MTSNFTPNGAALKECERMIQESLQSPMVRFLREHMEKAGCPVGDKFFKAVICKQTLAGGNYASGGYVPGEGIMVCANQMGRNYQMVLQDYVNQTVIHELIHAFDECRAANLNWTNCAHQACSEIRANHLSGDCHYKRELLRGFLKIRGHEQECIRRRVMKSLSVNPSCFGAAAKDCMEAVWDVCYNDTEPFERAP